MYVDDGGGDNLQEILREMERDELMEEEASYANELDEEFPGDGDGWREYVG